jgi:hypothetical protein
MQSSLNKEYFQNVFLAALSSPCWQPLVQSVFPEFMEFCGFCGWLNVALALYAACLASFFCVIMSNEDFIQLCSSN